MCKGECLTIVDKLKQEYGAVAGLEMLRKRIEEVISGRG